jgi:hypothetical protein
MIIVGAVVFLPMIRGAPDVPNPLDTTSKMLQKNHKVERQQGMIYYQVKEDIGV